MGTRRRSTRSDSTSCRKGQVDSDHECDACDRHEARNTSVTSGQRDAHLQATVRTDEHGAPHAYSRRDVQQTDVTEIDVQQMKHGARYTDFENDAVQQNGYRNLTVAFGPESTVGKQKEAQLNGLCGFQLELLMGNQASSVGRQRGPEPGQQ
ncbi:hypothetical protein VNO78_08061 [Psophocarpus tetragonolobus]|uniref:Uncharacterized protein n=1 Tax=Psophocarpus tetragonolobus TaxID=3891 RepID=A0AAN9T4A7_PSOTE